MVGLSGVVGEGADGCEIRTVPPTVSGGERAHTHRESQIAVRSSFHAGSSVEQPVETPDGTLVWVWGEVYSVTDPRGGRRSVDPRETARVCAEQYAEHGRDFVSRLDGEFLCCAYDSTAGTVSFFVDRIGARPLYYVEVGDRLAFSTSLQSLPDVPGFAPSFDETFLAEYLYARRVFGTKTPIEEVEQLAPATVLTYRLDSGETERQRYWQPTYRPVDRPLSYFVSEFRDRFERAVADRTGGDEAYGLLLSGGSDSRAVLGATDASPTCYHLGDGWNREARITKRVADAAGAPFELLHRGPDYHATLLERAAPIMEFLGTFNTGHALGFAERLADEVDVLLTGLYGDDLFGTWSISQPEFSLPFGARVNLPWADLPSTVAEFVSEEATAKSTRRPAFLEAAPFERILAANTRARNGGVDFHGVTYESVEQLSLDKSLYPITNGVGFDLYSALQILPTRNPFLDRRLIDLHLSMPLRHRLRHDPVHRAVAKLDPALAEIPHAATRTPIAYPKAVHAVANKAVNLSDRFYRRGSYRTQGPWQDLNAVARRHDFVGQSLDSNEALVRRLPCLDWEAARETYRRHRAGETDAGEELYRLITVLEMPLTRRVLDRESISA